MDLVIETDSEELFYTMLARGNSTLYHIQVKDRVNHEAFMATSNTICLWHRRMGHLNSNMIHTMH